MDIKVSENNVHIEDSYTTTRWVNMAFLLDDLRKAYPDCNTWKRSDDSLVREWRAHNLLYDLHLFRSHTKDVDLDYPEKWYTQIIYFILSLFYFKGGYKWN